MARKYLEQLNMQEGTPDTFGMCNDHRQSYWAKQRKEYGFDDRETWGLDYTFYIWLYERLMMFNEVNDIETTGHQYEYKGEVITHQDCIDRMIEGCKIALETDYLYGSKENTKKVDDVAKLWALCIRDMWW